MDECGPLREFTQFADRLPAFLCGQGIDLATIARRKRAQGDHENGKVADEPRSFKASSSKHMEFSLGLPNLEQDYEYDGSVGTQHFGSGLRRYVHKKTRMPRAVLTISKESIPKDVTPQDLDRQLQLLCRLDHPNIVPFRECCEDHRHFRLVYEWCEGGPLLTQLWRYDGLLSEGHVAQVIREVIAALVAADVFGVHHLDLSLFSLFLTYPDKLSPVKVFGLGLAGFVMPLVPQRKMSRTNKHCYSSPELFATSSLRHLNFAARHASDIFSVGCMLYCFCCGRPPFGIGTTKEMKERISRGRLVFGVEFSDYTSAVREVLFAMLVVDYKKRARGSKLLEMPWVDVSSTLHLKDGKISQVALSQLQSYAQADHVKQTVARMLTDIGITNNAYTELENKFREMDLNGDGTITLAELVTVSSSLGISEAEIDSIVGKLDRNGNCNVDITEFISALVMEMENADENLIRKAFSKMDRNGDARVTKKELFNVLRQYSGTVATDEVSQFVGKTDDDGDQKIDYREFMGLFPQVRGRYEEINARQQGAIHSINASDDWFRRFKEALTPWRTKVIALRDKCEIACEVREVPANLVAGTHYSYVKGHITEFDVQEYIRELTRALHHVPSLDSGKNKQKKAKAATGNQTQRKMKSAKDADDEGLGKPQMMGVSILSKAQDRAAGRATAQARTNTYSNRSRSPSGGESGSEDEERRFHVQQESAVKQWEWVMRHDIKTKKAASDVKYDESAYMFLALHWLIKVKAECHWQLPLYDMIKELRDSCVEEIIEVEILIQADLQKINTAVDDKYVCREDVKLDYCGTVIRRPARVLPMGCMRGKEMKQTVHSKELSSIDLPARFYFGYPKNDVTAERIKHMQNLHVRKLVEVGKYVNKIIEEVEALLEGVKEDLLMMSSIESGIPNPPPMSHLFLKHCEGRELDQDADTPRIEAEAKHGSDDGDGKFFASQGDIGGMSGTIMDGVDAAMSHSGTSPLATAVGSASDKHKGKRIERNSVLTTTHRSRAKPRH